MDDGTRLVDKQDHINQRKRGAGRRLKKHREDNARGVWVRGRGHNGSCLFWERRQVVTWGRMGIIVGTGIVTGEGKIKPRLFWEEERRRCRMWQAAEPVVPTLRNNRCYLAPVCPKDILVEEEDTSQVTSRRMGRCLPGEGRTYPGRQLITVNCLGSERGRPPRWRGQTRRPRGSLCPRYKSHRRFHLRYVLHTYCRGDLCQKEGVQPG